MNPEDRIRAAFEELSDRVPLEPTRPLTTGRTARFVPALAGAMAVAAVIGGIALLQLLPGDPPDSVPPATNTTAVTSVPPTSEPGTSSTTTPSTVDLNRFRVDTERVAADTSDPFLNVRRGPGVGNDLLAKLPPTYRGLAWTGASDTTEDGATWYEVELLHPLPGVNPAEPLEGSNPSGWVNAAYLLPLEDGISVGQSDLPACSGESEFGGGQGGVSYVSSLETARLTANCVRIVVGFGFGTGAFEWTGVTGDLLTTPPSWQERISPWPLSIALPDSAAAWPAATQADGVFVVRQPDLGLGLMSLLPADQVTVRTFEGWLVIDLEGGSQTLPPSGAGIQLTAEPFAAAGSIEVIGIARPFEATLGATVLDSSGNPVEAIWSGSSFLGTVRGDTYAVMTNDWTEAWGRFAVRAEGLEPGDYVISLTGDGGSDQPRTLDIPFTVDEAGSGVSAPSELGNTVAAALAGFATGGNPWPLADAVTLRLGLVESVSVPASQLASPEAWVVDADEFNGYSGPFDLLDRLRRNQHYSVAEARAVDHCASPPIDFWPGEEVSPMPIHIRPIGIDSCLMWFDLVVRLDADNRITEVVLDLYEP